MDKKDLMELRRRYKKDQCNIDRLACCYVDEQKNKITRSNEHFLNLPTDELEKYLDIVKKTVNGTIGDNVIEYEFPGSEEEAGGRQQYFNGLRNSGLKNDSLLDPLYDLIIKNFDYDGSYLILVFHDAYDIITRTTDKNKLDESEEVYEYILVSVCPMELSKAGLGYRKDDNRIGARIRDWIVSAPKLGILYPAFNEHSSDFHKFDYFLREPKESHPEIVGKVMGCGAKKTKEEKKQAFAKVITRAIEDKDTAESAIEGINKTILEKVANDPEMEVTDSVIKELIEISDVPIKDVDRVIKEYKAEVNEEPVTLSDLKEKKPKKKDKGIKEHDIAISIASERKQEIHKETIGDKEYLVIPVENDSEVTVNGSRWNG